jgi:hypothetical protein
MAISHIGINQATVELASPWQIRTTAQSADRIRIVRPSNNVRLVKSLHSELLFRLLEDSHLFGQGFLKLMASCRDQIMVFLTVFNCNMSTIFLGSHKKLLFQKFS